MSYSMLSTKRKFHRLLDSLTNGGASTASSRDNGTTDSTENGANVASEARHVESRAAKRQKTTMQQRSQLIASNPQLSRLLNQQAARRSTSYDAQSDYRTNRMSAGGNTQEATLGTTARLPSATWNPSDKNAFMDRMKTFQGVDWLLLVEEINAVAFAKWGWTLVGNHTVRCVSCSQQWVVLVLEDTPESFHSQVFVDKTKPRLEAEHGESCMWRISHCKDAIYSVTLHPPKHSLEKLRDRYSANMKHSRDLPYILTMPDELKDTHEKSLDAAWRALKSIYPSAVDTDVDSQIGLPESAEPRDFRLRAFALALFGWAGMPLEQNEPPVMGMLECTQCQARIGLWMYRSRDRPPSTPDVGRVIYEHLDVLGQHRMQCPWAVAETQYAGVELAEGVTPQAAWEIVRGMLLGQAASATRYSNVTAPIVASPGHKTPRTPVSGQSSAQRLDHSGSQEVEDASLEMSPQTSKITDEERKKKHKQHMSWLKKLRIGGKKDESHGRRPASGGGSPSVASAS